LPAYLKPLSKKYNFKVILNKITNGLAVRMAVMYLLAGVKR